MRWYFDFISPFAYLAWPRVRALLRERPVELRPILLAGLLERHGHKGPAEIEGKRLFTYRHALWRARRAGLPMRFPPGHPFNPLAALRLCLALETRPDVVQAIFDWIWAEGRAGDSAEALAPLAARLGIADVAAAITAPAVKQALRDNFEAAVGEGVFGVPTLVVNGEPFWGEDAMDFALEVLRDPELLQEPEFRRLAGLPVAQGRS
ncbi:2-hydroxychromene-2-carboxylate isomerase [Arenimonas fontis]|uniref:2-hydroxychromene-2-carboxylate isomerase n=1 Tax=Arenimonas fontis TaxID=2608255 RepID=A0A5B2Z9Y4_9GAMM|nr:2-hydroxychromene-2-carboxylate isomerase [Arenimonas fontis]KAA2284014.1 2-hydroxychromene-2-carboxylate isomerase [Arenimonas fontis]